MLVVLSVITVLLAMLGPALDKAKQGAKTAVCLMNMRAIGQGLRAYSAMHNEYIVPGKELLANSDRTVAKRNHWEAVLANGNLGLLDVPPAPPANAQADSSAFAGASLFRCSNGLAALSEWNNEGDPNHPDGARAVVRTFWDDPEMPEPTVRVHSWYAVNMWYDKQQPFVRLNAEKMYKSPAKMTDFRAPSDMVAVYDGLWSYEGGTKWWRINGRHQRTKDTNVLMLDGTARSFHRDILPFGPMNQLEFRMMSPYPHWRKSQE